MQDSSFDTDEKVYKVKIDDIERNKEIVDFVLVANHHFTFNVTGKWDITAPRLLPFWGEANNIELNENLGTRYDPDKFIVKMLRSVARVDFLSSIDQSSIQPSAYTFKIMSVSVYNSLNSGLIAPKARNLDENFRPTHPTLTTDSKYNTGSEFQVQIRKKIH